MRRARFARLDREFGTNRARTRRVPIKTLAATSTAAPCTHVVQKQMRPHTRARAIYKPRGAALGRKVTGRTHTSAHALANSSPFGLFRVPSTPPSSTTDTAGTAPISFRPSSSTAAAMSPPHTRSAAAASLAVAVLRGGCVVLLASQLLFGGCHGARSTGVATDTSAYTTDAGTYVSVYDHMDVGRLLKNEKLVSAYIKCFTNEGPCTVDGRQVKAVLLPEIIRTVCGKCTPRQKEMARQVLKHVYYTRNADFNRIMAIYDTEGKRDQLIAFMNQKK